MVVPGQINVLHGHCQRRVAKPLLQDVDRYALKNAVAPVGVPEGVGMDPGWLNADLGRGLLHSLPHRLAGQLDQRPVTGSPKRSFSRSYVACGWVSNTIEHIAPQGHSAPLWGTGQFCNFLR